MAMLAEGKTKQKWSEDPRNTKWSSDKERYGYQMLEKMGWADGKGLGKGKSGSTSHVKIKKRKQNLGLGAKESHDNDWIAQQADFNNLLSALQQHGGNAELRSEEQNKKAMFEVAKASRKRVFYKRFIRSKDTSQYSQKDMACIFGNLPSQSAPATPLSQSDDEVASEDSTVSCPTIPCDSTSGFVTYTSKQNIQEYFACRMKEHQDGKGIDRSNEGDKGVNREKAGDAERQDRIERGDGMDNQGDRGVYLDTEGEEKSKRKKRGNSENRPEMDSRKIKKRKKSKLGVKRDGKCVSGELKIEVKQGSGDMANEGNGVSENPETKLCKKLEVASGEMNEKWTKKSKKKSKRSMKEGIGGSRELENGTDGGAEENEKKLNDEEVLSKGSKVKTKKSKKVQKDDKLKDMDDSEKIANGVESVNEENEKKLYDEEVLSKGSKVKTKKSKKVKKDDKLKDMDDSEKIANGVESVNEENEKSLCDEDASSVRGGDKVKTKKSRKRTKDDMLDTKDKDVSGTVESCAVDNVPEQHEANISSGKEGKVKRKKSKKGERNFEVKGLDGLDMVVKDGTRKDENNLCEGVEQAEAFKQDKIKRKKSKKRTKNDKKDE